MYVRMNYAFVWLLSMLVLSLLGSYVFSGISGENDLFREPNYQYNGYKYLNRDI